MKKLNRFSQLSFVQQRIVLKSWWLFVVAHLRIRFGKVDPQFLVQQKTVDARTQHPVSVATLIHLSEAVGRNHVVPVNCLRRCLVQLQLLHAFGYAPKFHLGVRKASKLEAHCWLSLDNQPINDSAENLATYSELQTSAQFLKQLF